VHYIRNLVLLFLLFTLVFYGLTVVGIEPLAQYGNKAIDSIKPKIEQAFTTAKQGIEQLIAWGNGTSESSIEGRVQALYEATNKERIANGLQPFIRNATLEQLAQNQSESMHKRGNVDHLGFDNRSATAIGAGFDVTAENCAGGGYEASSFIEMWMNSPGHRANILNPRLTHIGIGIYGKYAVQDFGG